MTELTASPLWWEATSASDVLESAKHDFDTIRDCRTRQDRYYTFDRIYCNEVISESQTLEAELTQYGWELTEYQRASYNLIATVTDNITSRIVRTKPRAVYQVDGANWSLRRTAKMQQKWVDYVAHAKFFDRLAPLQIRDGVLKGTGYTKVFKRYGVNDIGVCHIDPSDIFVDRTEAAHGEIRRMFHRQFVSKDSARRMFPQHAEAIDRSGIISEDDFQNHKQYCGAPILPQIEIIEAWHLPTWVSPKGKTSGDGRHVIFCGEALLLDEGWQREDFPVLHWNWKHRPRDCHHGIGVGEEILGLHINYNFTEQQIHESAEHIANPHWAIPQGSNVSRNELNELPGMTIEYMGNVPPQIVQPPKIPVDLVQYRDAIEAAAYRRLGLDSATPNEPSPGLETGRAVRMDFDARSIAFASALQNWENLYKDFGDKAVAAGRQIWEKDKSFSVVVPRNKWTVQDVPWKDVALNPRKHSYTIKVYAGSQLSQHPAGRIDDVSNLVNMGAVTEKTEIRALTGLPDLEHSNDLATSTREAIEWMCEEMLDEGISHVPEPYDDMELALKISNAQYLIARTQGAPEKHLQLVRDFMDICTAEIAKKQIAQQAQAQALLPPAATPPAPDALGQNPSAITG